MEKIAQTYELEGDWKLTNYPSGDAVAAFFYEKASRSYRNLGLRQKSDELVKKVKKHTKESEKTMKTIETKIQIPTELIQKYIERLNSLTLEKALEAISKNDLFIPNTTLIKNALKKQRGTSLSLVIPRVSIRDGNPSFRSQTDDEIFDDNFISRFSFEIQLRGIILENILDELTKTKNLNPEKLVEYILKSKIFETNSKKILKTGFQHYFDADYISCLHVLTPQLERAMRHLLALLKVPTTCIGPDGIMEKTLGTILREKELVDLLGENISTYFNTMLIDKRGDNLRNDVSHGLIDESSCNKKTATNLVFLFLILTKFEL